jgi:hypothetical protein
VAGCGSVTVEGRLAVDVVLRDDAAGVAVLRPRAAVAPPAVAAAAPLPRPGAEVAVAGYPFGDALTAPVLTFGAFAAEGGLMGEAGVARLTLRAMPGDVGAPVLDPGGALVGILLPPPGDAARVLPPDVAYIAPVAALAPALAPAGVTLATGARAGAMAPEDLARAGRALAVQVSCWD